MVIVFNPVADTTFCFGHGFIGIEVNLLIFDTRKSRHPCLSEIWGSRLLRGCPDFSVGPRLAGQNVMYIKSQIEAFANGARQTVQSAIMQPVVAGLTDGAIEALAHYYNSVQK